MDTDNGGPAYPTGFGGQGMTLRDWFAGQALAGVTADPNIMLDDPKLAGVAYRVADAMLEARKVKHDGTR